MDFQCKNAYAMSALDIQVNGEPIQVSKHSENWTKLDETQTNIW